MSVIEAIILGIVQGLTEFLPVSSSGHLELGSFFLNIQSSDNLLFSVMVHGATALSTIVVFRKDIIKMFGDVLEFTWNESTKYVAMILVSMVPVGIIGVLWQDQIEGFFGGKVVFVSSMLMITSLLLTISFFAGKTKGNLSFGKAFVIGLAQAFALLPGISRSGATISTALILGIERSKAARFSFLMVLIPILGATFLKLKDYFQAPATSNDIPVLTLIAGFLAAFISGFIACKWMIRIVNKGKLIYFAIYCFIIATITLIIYL